MKTIYMVMTLLLLASVAGADYSISWYTIDGGGGTSSGGQYSVTGTIGQPDAGYLDESPYELLGGFWVGGPLCIVDFEQFATLASYWLEVSCDGTNNYCAGADLVAGNGVNAEDLNRFVLEWLNTCPFGWPLQ